MLKKIALIVLLSATAALAQEKATVYRLEYTLTEMEGAKKLSSRSYTMMVEDRRHAFIRVGTRVPVRSGSENQYNYIDIGVNLDATATMLDAGTLRLESTFDITSMVAQESATARAPVMRSCKDSVTTLIPIDKLVTLTTQDDPSNNNTQQIQVIAKIVK